MSKTIKDILDGLPAKEKARLMYAHEHELCQYAQMPDGTFVGVNCELMKNFQIEQRAGSWAAGKIK